MDDNKRARPPVFHPFLLAAYPVIALLAHNIEEVQLRIAWRPLVVSLALSSALFVLLYLSLRDWHKAGLAAAILLLLFFSYGHVYEFFEGKGLIGSLLGRHRYLVFLYLALFAGSLLCISRQNARHPQLTRLLNIITCLALVIPIMQVEIYELRLRRSQAEGIERFSQPVDLALRPEGVSRDVYYLILDGYARDDILKKYYRYDNQPFLDRLSQMGFYIAPCSLSNYAQTQLSLASSLNFAYLDALGEGYRAGNSSRLGLVDLIRHSQARQIFEALGYQVIAFDTGYDATRWKDADLYLSPRVVQDIDDFEAMFIRTTAARLVSEGVAFLDLPPDWEKRDQLHRERILYTLEKLRTIAELPGPKFVFAHLITPHWPHVFGPGGEAVHEHNDSISGYRNQVEFINSQILPILSALISESATPPIIILQADHGSIIESLEQRMSILNAYYFPERSEPGLYESISPVNTFRQVFNLYYNADFSLFEDASYYSRYESPYEYQEYNDSRAGCP